MKDVKLFLVYQMNSKLFWFVNCLFEANATLMFDEIFQLEWDYDFLKFNNVILRSRPMNGIKEVRSGTVMTFTSDESTQNAGFRFCAAGNDHQVF